MPVWNLLKQGFFWIVCFPVFVEAWIQRSPLSSFLLLQRQTRLFKKQRKKVFLSCFFFVQYFEFLYYLFVLWNFVVSLLVLFCMAEFRNLLKKINLKGSNNNDELCMLYPGKIGCALFTSGKWVAPKLSDLLLPEEKPIRYDLLNPSFIWGLRVSNDFHERKDVIKLTPSWSLGKSAPSARTSSLRRSRNSPLTLPPWSSACLSI